MKHLIKANVTRKNFYTVGKPTYQKISTYFCTEHQFKQAMFRGIRKGYIVEFTYEILK